jgi:hypothetical protein
MMGLSKRHARIGIFEADSRVPAGEAGPSVGVGHCYDVKGTLGGLKGASRGTLGVLYGYFKGALGGL